MEIDEWFGTADTDFNLCVVDDVIHITRYDVIDGRTQTATGRKVLEIKIGTENWFELQIWR